MSLPHVPSLTLRTGATIPQLGVGTFKVPPEQTQRLVEDALELGYRHLDTAQMYSNEREVGAGLAASGLAREAVFLTTKLGNREHRPDDARRAFDQSLEDLGVDYVDLFLIHWPVPMHYDGDIMPTWRALEEFHADGRARAIGLSNFLPHHAEPILAQGETMPAINQIESHPYLPARELHAFNAQHGIITEAWSPLARGKLVDDPTLKEIGQAYGKSAAQVALRWALERGDVIFPKSLSRERMAQNADLFDFSLSAEETARIDGLDRGEDGRAGSHPDTRDWT